MEDLLERVIAIAEAFDRSEIPHSFGGAIALGYYATARPTRDISHMLDSMGDRLDLPYLLRWIDVIVGSNTPPARKFSRALAQRSLAPAP